jgi:predicted DNA-binding protein with PD1-like motif
MRAYHFLRALVFAASQERELDGCHSRSYKVAVHVVSYRVLSQPRLSVKPLEGASIRETIRELLQGHAGRCAVITGLGRVDGVRLAREDHARAGALQVISLSGIISPTDAKLALLGVDDAGAFVGGELTDARAVDLELLVELLEREVDAEVAVEPATTAKPSWAEVAAASMQPKEHELPVEEDDGIEAPTPRPGDLIEHANFGVCTVQRVDDDDFVHVRAVNQRLLRLSLEVLRLQLMGEDDGHRRYRARARAAVRR